MSVATSIAISQLAAGNPSAALAYGLAASGKANLVGGAGTNPEKPDYTAELVALGILMMISIGAIIAIVVKH